jgi:hypothetical protein
MGKTYLPPHKTAAYLRSASAAPPEDPQVPTDLKCSDKLAARSSEPEQEVAHG